jgi:hypothetical protein
LKPEIKQSNVPSKLAGLGTRKSELEIDGNTKDETKCNLHKEGKWIGVYLHRDCLNEHVTSLFFQGCQGAAGGVGKEASYLWPGNI